MAVRPRPPITAGLSWKAGKDEPESGKEEPESELPESQCKCRDQNEAHLIFVVGVRFSWVGGLRMKFLQLG